LQTRIDIDQYEKEVYRLARELVKNDFMIDASSYSNPFYYQSEAYSHEPIPENDVQPIDLFDSLINSHPRKVNDRHQRTDKKIRFDFIVKEMGVYHVFCDLAVSSGINNDLVDLFTFRVSFVNCKDSDKLLINSLDIVDFSYPEDQKFVEFDESKVLNAEEIRKRKTQAYYHLAKMYEKQKIDPPEDAKALLENALPEGSYLRGNIKNVKRYGKLYVFEVLFSENFDLDSFNSLGLKQKNEEEFKEQLYYLLSEMKESPTLLDYKKYEHFAGIHEHYFQVNVLRDNQKMVFFMKDNRW